MSCQPDKASKLFSARFSNFKYVAMTYIGKISSFLVFSLLLVLSGCSVIGDIFEAGVWAGVLLVVVVIALFVWLLKKLLS